MESISLPEMFNRFADHWAPKKIGDLNDYEIKLAKVQGQFIWHKHPETDELFMVLDGELTIQMRDGHVTLRPLDLFVVPKGVEHCPLAEVETSILLIEPVGVVNTGDAGGEMTAELRTLT